MSAKKVDSIRAQVDPETLFAENVATQREILAILKDLKAKNDSGNGANGKVWDVWRILISLAFAIAVGAHGLLWYLDKTVAVQTTQIESANERINRNERDISNLDASQREHLRDHNGSSR